MVELAHGGDLIAFALKKHGVRFVFTLTGGHISPILTGAEKLGIEVVDVRHEATAVFAADAVSRLSGTPGVAIVTAGPGVTNTITPLKNAQMAQSPLLLFGGATALVLKKRGSLQDIDQHSIVKSMVKWSTTIKNVKEIPQKISEAFFKAQSGVPGPVFIEVPIDVLYPEHLVRDMYGIDKIKGTGLSKRITRWYLSRTLNRIFSGANYNPEIIVKKPELKEAPTSKLIQAASLLSTAKKPLIIAGSQLVQNHELLWKARDVINSLSIPIYLSGMARGLMGKECEFQFRHRRREAIKKADVVLLLGVPLDFRLDYGRLFKSGTKVISINRSKKDLMMNKDLRGVDLPILGDPSDAIIRLSDLLGRITEVESYLSNNDVRDNWIKELEESERKRDNEINRMSEQKSDKVNPLYLCKLMDKHIPEDSIFIGDGGDFIATFSYIVKPRGPLSWLDPGVFGTLGSGGGFALGAKKVFPDKDIFLIYGDGSFGYSMAEWDTFVRHGISILGLIGNDAQWAQIAREQEDLLGSPVATSLSPTGYEKAVEGLGAKGYRIESDEEVEKKLELAIKSLKNGDPVLVNAIISKSDFRKGSLSM